MRKEVIRATPSWRRSGSRYDCVFVETDPAAAGFRGLHVARVKLFFSFKYLGHDFSCALVRWFRTVGEQPNANTGMWIVEPEFLQAEDEDDEEVPYLAIIDVKTIIRAAHLIPVYGENFNFSSADIDPSQTLDSFKRFFVNKYIDHHAYEIAF